MYIASSKSGGMLQRYVDVNVTTLLTEQYLFQSMLLLQGNFEVERLNVAWLPDV